MDPRVLASVGYVQTWAYQKSTADSTFYSKGVTYVDPTSRLGSTSARSNAGQYVTATDMATSGSVSLSTANILADGNIVLGAG